MHKFRQFHTTGGYDDLTGNISRECGCDFCRKIIGEAELSWREVEAARRPNQNRPPWWSKSNGLHDYTWKALHYKYVTISYCEDTDNWNKLSKFAQTRWGN